MSARAQALPIPDEQSIYSQTTLAAEPAERRLMIANGAPTPPAQPLPASDPLGAIKAMTEEEKIALFT